MTPDENQCYGPPSSQGEDAAESCIKRNSARKSTLILVSGPPASGKSYLARLFAERLTLPLYSRDAIKETLFDTLGWSEKR